MFVIYGPFKTWTAELVTDPLLVACGLAIAVTGTDSSASTEVGSNKSASETMARFITALR